MSSKFLRLPVIIIVLAVLLVGVSLAQSPGDRGPRPDRGKRMLERIPDLTDEQIEQIKDLRTQHLKDVLPLQNQVQEKQAHLKSISSGEKVDMIKIDKTIEEIGQLKTTMAKKRAAHRQKIRKTLTEDQRIIFDSIPMKHGPRKGHGRLRCDMRPGKRF